MKVLSWNIWINGYFDKITEFIQSANADIIGLQEVRDDDPNRNIIGFLQGLGYKYVYAPVKKVWGDQTWNDGPAIFTRYDIVKSEIYNLSNTENRVAIKADIRTETKLLHVYSTHLIHTHQQESEIQREQIENLIKNLTREQTIVMGDFNAIPNSSTINMMQKIMTDTDPLSQPTWSIYPEGCEECNPQDINIRLDYIFVSEDITVKSFEVGNSKGSDHLPILSNLEL